MYNKSHHQECHNIVLLSLKSEKKYTVYLQEWLLTGMFTKMEFQRFLQSEGFITQCTRIRFDARVAIHVSCKNKRTTGHIIHLGSCIFLCKIPIALAPVVIIYVEAFA